MTFWVKRVCVLNCWSFTLISYTRDPFDHIFSSIYPQRLFLLMLSLLWPDLGRKSNLWTLIRSSPIPELDSRRRDLDFYFRFISPPHPHTPTHARINIITQYALVQRAVRVHSVQFAADRRRRRLRPTVRPDIQSRPIDLRYNGNTSFGNAMGLQTAPR